MDLIYLIIYNRHINFCLRWLNKLFSSILPESIKIPPSGVIRIRSGKRSFRLATNQTSYLTQRLFWYGRDSFEYSEIFTSLIKKTGTFFDVGANIGYYSVLACTENPHVNVHAFEPARGALHYLRTNIALNSLEQRVSIVNAALSDSGQILTFQEVENRKYRYTDHVLSGENNASTKTLSRDFKTYEVPGMTLDDYCRENSIDNIDLIKIDTEGSEFRILTGGEQTLSQSRPVIVCEILYDFNEEKIESIMNRHGYEAYIFDKSRLVKTDSIIRAVDDGVRDCFFVHPDRYPLISEYVEK